MLMLFVHRPSLRERIPETSGYGLWRVCLSPGSGSWIPGLYDLWTAIILT